MIVVRRKYDGIEDDLICRYISRGSYLPVSYCISVYDRERDNVVIRDGMFIRDSHDESETETIPLKKVLTADREQLEDVKRIITDSGVLKIRSFPIPKYVVCDGSYEICYFRVGSRRKLMEGDNMFITYEDDANVEAIIKALNGILDMFDPEEKIDD